MPENTSSRSLELLLQNTKEFLKGSFGPSGLKDVPKCFKYKAPYHLHKSAAGNTITYKHRETGRTLNMENYFWNALHEMHQTIIVARGPDLPEPVIIVKSGKGISDLKIWKGDRDDDSGDLKRPIVKGIARPLSSVMHEPLSRQRRSSTARNVSRRPRGPGAVGHGGTLVPEIINLIGDEEEVPFKRKTQDVSEPHHLTTIVFLDAEDDEIRRRTLKDCNTILRLFAQATAAEIRTKDGAMLLVSIRGSPPKPMLIVQGDEKDLSKLVEVVTHTGP